MHQHQITIVTFFPAEVEVPDSLTLYNGDGTLPGFARTLRAALQAGDYDLIHAHYAHVGSMFILLNFLSLPRYRCKLVYTVHTSYPNLKLRNRLMTWIVFLFFRRIIFCSHASYQSFPPLVKRLVGRRGYVVQNGVDMARIDRILAAVPPPPPSRPLTVLAIGRLIPLKQPLKILEAFAQSFPDNGRLIFIGQGGLETALRERIEAQGLSDRVTLTGPIPRDEVYRYLKEADIFISASTVEGLPVAVIEAMTARCPVILSDIPPHRVIANGAGFIPLLAPEDIKGFAQALTRFAQLSAEARTEIGEQCRAIVQQHFSLEQMHAQYDQIFASLV
ncbi:MAG: glycosyltransferase family 4 protein [Anaerolineae bacterium]|nr:glycosyltransferase family 4 protein [Anaerolineae bacterium]